MPVVAVASAVAAAVAAAVPAVATLCAAANVLAAKIAVVAVAVVGAAAIATAVCLVVDSAAGAVGAAHAVCTVVALMPLPAFILVSSVFGAFLQPVGRIALFPVMRQVSWNRLLLATVAWPFGLPHLRPWWEFNIPVQYAA